MDLRQKTGLNPVFCLKLGNFDDFFSLDFIALSPYN